MECRPLFNTNVLLTWAASNPCYVVYNIYVLPLCNVRNNLLAWATSRTLKNGRAWYALSHVMSVNFGHLYQEPISRPKGGDGASKYALVGYTIHWATAV